MRIISIYLLLLLFACGTSKEQSHKTYDVVVVGGGASGTMAGIQSARLGSVTLIIEETPWLGGMLTSAGVSATAVIVAAGGRPVLLAHFGRPGGERRANLSLDQLVPTLENAFGAPVIFASDCVGAVAELAAETLQSGQVLLLENTRLLAQNACNGSCDKGQHIAERIVNEILWRHAFLYTSSGDFVSM